VHILNNTESGKQFQFSARNIVRLIAMKFYLIFAKRVLLHVRQRSSRDLIHGYGFPLWLPCVSIDPNIVIEQTHSLLWILFAPS